ncbi:MAG: SRPBCC family protein [Pedobacter sp.]|nr:MAG: SRPBCC family protein [Pedobacter sp.]
MKNFKFTEKIVIRSDQETVFDYTQDYSRRLVWDTFLRRAELIDGAKAPAAGVVAYCVSKHGMGMYTEYVTFNRPNVTAIRMTKGPKMFRDFLGSWNFRPAGEGLTEVTFLYSFDIRFPFSLFSGLIRAILKNNVRQRLKDLKVAVENLQQDGTG